MSDEPITDAQSMPEKIIAELREWRENQEGGESWTARLTFREIDTLLAAAAERDALRRRLADMPDEITPGRFEAAFETFGETTDPMPCAHESWERFGLTGRRCADCRMVIE